MSTNYITREDERSAKLCDLAAARLRLDRTAMARITEELHALGYAARGRRADRAGGD